MKTSFAAWCTVNMRCGDVGLYSVMLIIHRVVVLRAAHLLGLGAGCSTKGRVLPFPDPSLLHYSHSIVLLYVC